MRPSASVAAGNEGLGLALGSVGEGESGGGVGLAGGWVGASVTVGVGPIGSTDGAGRLGGGVGEDAAWHPRMAIAAAITAAMREALLIVRCIGPKPTPGARNTKNLLLPRPVSVTHPRATHAGS
jgi:hypothetical protein